MFLQIQVAARDFGSPRLSGVVRLVINVDRNLNNPSIRPALPIHRVETYEDDPTTVPLFNFQAVDADRAVSFPPKKFELVICWFF